MRRVIAWLIAVTGSYVMNSLTTFSAETKGKLRLKDYVGFVGTGLVAVIVQLIGIVLTSGAIVRERERGTYEQLLVTPISPFGLGSQSLLWLLMARTCGPTSYSTQNLPSMSNTEAGVSLSVSSFSTSRFSLRMYDQNSATTRCSMICSAKWRPQAGGRLTGTGGTPASAVR